jgi:ABC-type Fe3+ transport system substrate-binding protein
VHPHGALLMADFLLSPEGQAVLAKFYYGSARARQSRNQDSDYLPQGRKGRRLQMTIIENNSISLPLKLGGFAPSRDESPTTEGNCAQTNE